MSPPTGPKSRTITTTTTAIATATAIAITTVSSPPTRSTPPQPQSTPPHPQSTPSPPHPFDMHTLDLALNLDLALASTHLTDTMSPSLPPTTLPSSGWANIWDDTVPLGQAMNGSTKPYNTNTAVNSTSHVPPTTGTWTISNTQPIIHHLSQSISQHLHPSFAHPSLITHTLSSLPPSHSLHSQPQADGWMIGCSRTSLSPARPVKWPQSNPHRASEGPVKTRTRPVNICMGTVKCIYMTLPRIL